MTCVALSRIGIGPHSRKIENLSPWLRSLTYALLAAWFVAVVPIVEAQEKQKQQDKENWKPLFDGKTTNGWKVTDFGGQGEIKVENGNLVLEIGSSLTGLTYAGKDFPKQDYEISLEAMRMEGTDFFCGLTFPVRDSHASFIVGGWGGGVVGISSIDGQDASENETTQVISFTKGKWYKLRIRVTAERIVTWIDDKKIVDQDIKDRRISTRIEVDPSKPLGVCTYETKAAIREFKYRTLAK